MRDVVVRGLLIRLKTKVRSTNERKKGALDTKHAVRPIEAEPAALFVLEECCGPSSSTVFYSERTNLSPFTKDYRE